jgi:hypothetical protein
MNSILHSAQMNDQVIESGPMPRRSSIFSRAAIMGWLVCLILTASGQWLLGPALFVLLVAWRVFRREGDTVVLAAFGYQWVQVTLALFYAVFTGRHVVEMTGVDFQPMVLISLVSICALFVGFLWTSSSR